MTSEQLKSMNNFSATI